MKPNNVRTSIDIPRNLHRKLRQEAAKRGCSARSLILAAIQQTVAAPAPRKGRLKLDRPLLADGSRKVSTITSERSMSLVFPDVNVWVALTIGHVHQKIALDWWRRERGTIGFCRFTQIGLLRLLATSAAMDGKPLSMKHAWNTYDVLARDERAEFVSEPPALEHAFRGLSSSNPSPKLWADTYLTAFASECGGSLVTFDRSLARRSRGSVFLE